MNEEVIDMKAKVLKEKKKKENLSFLTIINEVQSVNNTYFLPIRRLGIVPTLL